MTTTEATQPGKTLWDWLQLLGILAIPIVVGFGTAFFTSQQARTSEASRKEQHDTDLQIAENQQQEELLRTYFDKISDLLLDKELSTNPNIESVVRARTLAALHILNTVRKTIVLRFLHDSDLLPYVKSFLYSLDLNNTDLNRINLSRATLSRANLSRANLRWATLSRTYLGKADLRWADLSGADLRMANLIRADLSKADLHWADLRWADLSGADLSGATATSERFTGAKNVTPAQLAQIKQPKPEIPKVPQGAKQEEHKQPKQDADTSY